MAMSNSQYNAAMRGYEERQRLQRRAMEARVREVYSKIPQIQELERKYELLSRTLELLKTARDRFLGRYLTTLKEKTAEYLAVLEPAWKDSIEM